MVEFEVRDFQRFTSYLNFSCRDSIAFVGTISSHLVDKTIMPMADRNVNHSPHLGNTIIPPMIVCCVVSTATIAAYINMSIAMRLNRHSFVTFSALLRTVSANVPNVSSATTIGRPKNRNVWIGDMESRKDM